VTLTNITIDLFLGDPNKGRTGWCFAVQFTDPNTGKREHIEVKMAHEDLDSALKMAASVLYPWLKPR
jgi:hypothetical protein